jgi:hypothetical protein
MPTADLGSVNGLAGPVGPLAFLPGCPRCGSTCAQLDDCAVCTGKVICARCLFGPRVEDDEIHATLVLSG